MRVNEIELTVQELSPGKLPRVGETMTLQLPRMDEPQEFVVSEMSVKRRWVNEEGDDEGYIYEGAITLEAVYEDDDEDDDEREPESSAPEQPVAAATP